MPTYLCHGFRWKRRSIRVYVVVQNLDEAAPEWVVKRGSPRCLIESFYNLFDFLPECTLPPTRRSSFAPRSYSQAHSLDRSSSVADDDDDDDAASHYTARSARGRSTSQGRTVVAQQSQPHLQSQYCQDKERDRDTSVLPASSYRESSNSSRKRSRSEIRGKPLPPTTHAPAGYQPPPSPPSSQPQFVGSLSHASDAVTADPVLAQEWSPVKVLEEHDPNNLDEVSRPYAYVADYVQRIDSSCSIVEEIARYEHMVRASREPAVTGPSSDETLNGKRDTSRLGDHAGWFEQLRDQLQRGEDIRWYVVVNGDEEREWPADAAGSRPETRAQMAHHTYYVHQQLIFEGQDRDLEMRREQLRREFGYNQGGIDRLADRRVERRPPAVPGRELQPLRIDVPMHPSGPSHPKTPKTPRKGSFRRLFGRSKFGDQTPVNPPTADLARPPEKRG
jgi:hypothetical protein